MMRKLTPNQLKELDVFILRNDAIARQTGKVTDEMRERYQNRIIFTPEPRAADPKDIARMRNNIDAEREQLRQMAEQRRWDSLSPDQQFEEENLLGAEQLVQLTEDKLAKARSRRQHAAIERYEKELEQRQQKLRDTRERLAAVNRDVAASAELRDDVDYQYALTCAKSAVDVTDRGTESHTKASIFLQDLETATPQNYKNRMAAFHAWDADRLAVRRAELLAAENAALQAANPHVSESFALGKQAAEAGLQQIEATRRAGGQE